MGALSDRINDEMVTTAHLQVCAAVDYAHCSDEMLWEAFKQGDECAYELIYERNFDALFTYGKRFGCDEDDLRDHIQQLFTTLWESKKRLGRNTAIRSYLMACIRRMILRGSQSKFQFVEWTNLPASQEGKLARDNDFVHHDTMRTMCLQLQQLIARLPKRQKEAVCLKYFDDHSFADIAEIMGISTRVVYKLNYKALARMAQYKSLLI